MKYRVLIPALLILIADTVCLSLPTAPTQSVIELSRLGYPQPPCDYMFQDKDAYAKRHVEFLDSQRLLVSFPVRSQACDKSSFSPPQRFRSVIVTTSGEALNSFEWGSGENVQVGPDGHILQTTGREIRILDSAFTVIQTIPWVPERDPTWNLMHYWPGRIIVAPSRHGFFVHDSYPQYRVGYFEGNTAKQILTADSCPRQVAVTDGGFACTQTVAGSIRLEIRVGSSEWKVDDSVLQHTFLLLFPNPQTLLAVTDKFQLYQLNSGKKEIADLRWLAPGWNSGFRYEVSSAAAGRVLFFSHGTRFPITDTSGFGRYLRVAVLDVTSKAIIFRKQCPIDSDVAISPDGRLLAVREKDRVSLIVLAPLVR